jgi:hypothetical protein
MAQFDPSLRGLHTRKFEFREVPGGIDVYYTRKGAPVEIATIRNRIYKRSPVTNWGRSVGAQTTLAYIQSSAGLQAALRGYSGPK